MMGSRWTQGNARAIPNLRGQVFLCKTQLHRSPPGRWSPYPAPAAKMRYFPHAPSLVILMKIRGTCRWLSTHFHTQSFTSHKILRDAPLSP